MLSKKMSHKKVYLMILMLVLLFVFSACKDTKEPDDCEYSEEIDWSNVKAEKPVIYLYPEVTTDVNIKLEVDGEITFTYPDYNNGWSVKADPDGQLHTRDGQEYSYLFWEGNLEYTWEIEEGFVVEGTKTVEFLEQKLDEIGLTPKEYHDFIVYWAPLMQENNYNLIYFAQEEYEELARLSIKPEPESVLRVFMVYQPLQKAIEIKEQKLDRFERSGFTVVEWGGTKIE